MAEIVFEELTSSPETLGSGLAPLPALQTFGSDQSNVGIVVLPVLATLGDGALDYFAAGLATMPALEAFGAQGAELFTTYVGFGIAQLPLFTTTGTEGALIAEPQDGMGEFDLPALETEGAGFMHVLGGSGEFDLPLLEVYGFETGDANFGVATLPGLSSYAFEEPYVPDTYITGLLFGAGYIEGSNTMLIESDLTASDTLIAELLWVLESRVTFSADPEALATLLMTVRSSLVARDFVAFVIDILLNDEFQGVDEVEVTPEAIMAIASALVAADETLGLMTATQIVASVLTVLDRVRFDVTLTVESVADFVDLIEADLALAMTLASEALLTDEANGLAVMTALVDSNLVVGDGVEGLLSLLMALDDTFSLSVRLTTPEGDVFAGYVLNVRNAAASELTNFNFNSFATVSLGGRRVTLAARQDGVFQFGGQDDDGTPIDALVRLGLSDFGTSQLKRVANAYIGYTADGELRLKVITTDGGKKKENWYKLAPRTVASPDGARFDIAKGLTARYWGFVLENIDGADFELDNLQIWPAVLGRRKKGR